MPELPEVESVRRMLQSCARGRVIRRVRRSGLRLREAVSRSLPSRLEGRSIEDVRRHGKFLLIDLDHGLSLISHLGMSGRWLFHARPPVSRPRHVHVRLEFRDGSVLWFEDPRRFGLLKLVATAALTTDPSLRHLGPDPIQSRIPVEALIERARGARVSIKSFLLDQRRIAGIGNIYASEILHRAAVDPRCLAGRVRPAEWEAIAREIPLVLGESIDRMGTTFSTYRLPSGDSGDFASSLRVYDRAGEPCVTCGTKVVRIVQSQRSTFYCPRCQARNRERSRSRTILV